MIFIPNYHWNHTKFEFGMIPVVIWYEYHTSVFAVYNFRSLVKIIFKIAESYLFNFQYSNHWSDIIASWY